jgi:hypothetical protein
MVFVEILVSVLAAFGVFCLFKLIAEEWLIPDDQLPPQCICLKGNESDEEIRALFDAALASWTRRAHGEVIVYCERDGAPKKERIEAILQGRAVLVSCIENTAREEGREDEQ